jgi:ubiquinone/menaquinone biosynthesis C-methylase UbiE
LKTLDDFLHECFGFEFLLILLVFFFFFFYKKFRIWKRVVQNGDTVIDATCGNGYDTLAMLKMVADELGRGRVYGMDIQGDALKRTSSLLDESVTLKEVILSRI